MFWTKELSKFLFGHSCAQPIVLQRQTEANNISLSLCLCLCLSLSLSVCLPLSLSLYIYISVCVCVRARARVTPGTFAANDKLITLTLVTGGDVTTGFVFNYYFITHPCSWKSPYSPIVCLGDRLHQCLFSLCQLRQCLFSLCQATSMSILIMSGYVNVYSHYVRLRQCLFSLCQATSMSILIMSGYVNVYSHYFRLHQCIFSLWRNLSCHRKHFLAIQGLLPLMLVSYSCFNIAGTSFEFFDENVG